MSPLTASVVDVTPQPVPPIADGQPAYIPMCNITLIVDQSVAPGNTLMFQIPMTDALVFNNANFNRTKFTITIAPI